MRIKVAEQKNERAAKSRKPDVERKMDERKPAIEKEVQ
jgi:hypothetical protein